MRRQIKKQLKNSVEYLAHTADNLGEFLKGFDREKVIDILGQMQGLAVEVGNMIESTEDTDSGSIYSQVIHKLEDACERLYQISCSLDEVKIRERMSKELKELFLDIKRDIETIVPEKLEIVFLPYQASMWDSLESIWMAARENPDVECYVVPIPFYDVRQDNSLGQMHYEGNNYPAYVPVTPYWEYSIEKRMPDAVFIHNPYDEYNRVTRIPERYYARNLKKYTGKLVYVPYFISEEGGPGDHQCSTPGVLFADRVVVEPGSIYGKYCRIYTNVLKENELESVLVPAEKKFLPFGSPKVDRVRNIQCSIEELPEEWKRIILKPDGSRKKIILYNLTIGTVLGNKEQYIKKMDGVFEFFRERQEDFVLWWRPHPLLLKTFESMLPWLKQEYVERIKRFKDEGWGIYDETPDSNLAVALSDAYYGDGSSVLTAYRETGKPILRQNVWTV